MRTDTKQKKPGKIGNYIQNERQFTLLRCSRCGEFYDKYKKHACREHNSFEFRGGLITEEETGCTTK